MRTSFNGSRNDPKAVFYTRCTIDLASGEVRMEDLPCRNLEDVLGGFGRSFQILAERSVSNAYTPENPLIVNRVLSYLVYGTTAAEVKGLNAFPRENWPENIPLLYYSYHIMVGLGTMFIAVMVLAALLLWRGKLYNSRWALWIVMLSLPFPYIANTAGWMVAEIGRQPWLVYGMLRTSAGYSHRVSAGDGWFTLLGFLGMYTMLSIFFLFLVYREIEHGPEREAAGAPSQPVTVA